MKTFSLKSSIWAHSNRFANSPLTFSRTRRRSTFWFTMLDMLRPSTSSSQRTELKWQWQRTITDHFCWRIFWLICWRSRRLAELLSLLLNATDLHDSTWRSILTRSMSCPATCTTSRNSPTSCSLWNLPDAWRDRTSLSTSCIPAWLTLESGAMFLSRWALAWHSWKNSSRLSSKALRLPFISHALNNLTESPENTSTTVRNKVSLLMSPFLKNTRSCGKNQWKSSSWLTLIQKSNLFHGIVFNSWQIIH